MSSAGPIVCGACMTAPKRRAIMEAWISRARSSSLSFD
jgi:hypothetical protein